MDISPGGRKGLGGRRPGGGGVMGSFLLEGESGDDTSEFQGMLCAALMIDDLCGLVRLCLCAIYCTEIEANVAVCIRGVRM